MGDVGNVPILTQLLRYDIMSNQNVFKLNLNIDAERDFEFFDRQFREQLDMLMVLLLNNLSEGN